MYIYCYLISISVNNNTVVTADWLVLHVACCLGLAGFIHIAVSCGHGYF